MQAPDCRVLLVEDDPGQSVVIKVLLARIQTGRFILTIADCLSTALDSLASTAADVILLDLSLPDSQGLDTVIKVRERTAAIPIIVLTGNDDENLALDTINHGAQDYLVKGTLNGALLTRSIRYAIQRFRSERALAAQRNRQRLLMESIPDCRIYFKDKGGRFLEVNMALAKHSGLDDPQQAIGKTDFDLFTEEHAKLAAQDEREVMRTGQPIIGKVEKEMLRDGRISWALTTKMPLPGEEGETIGIFGISRDISELKQAEQKLIEINTRLTTAVDDLLNSNEELKATQLQLIQAEKLQSLGQMAASVAHEVKNPLAILHMGIECLDEHFFGDNEQMNMIVSEMKDAVIRAESVIRDMLDYSSARNLELHPVCVNSLVSQTLRFVRHDLNRGKVRVVTLFSEDIPTCQLDAPKIEQVFVNVFINACHAMPEGGSLTIETFQRILDTDETEPDAPDCENIRFRKGDKVVVVEVRDTGTGIPEEKLQRIFDPFFTTKASGKGTGLGLSVVRKIIDLHGGKISIANAEGGGVRVTIMLKPDA
jgi:PAS domain S-box-containing protein